MSEAPVQVIVAAFDEEVTADEVLKELKAARRADVVSIQNAAVLRRDEKNALHIREEKDWGGGKGAAVGGALGAIVGVLAGPGVLVAGAAGALIGGLAAKLRDSGFSDERLRRVGESLKPGTSAIVAVVEHTWVAELEKEMLEANAEIVTAAIAIDVAGQLQAGREVAYTALSSVDGLAFGRATGGSDAGTELEAVVVTDDSILAENVAESDEGIYEERLVLTENGVILQTTATNSADDLSN